MEVSILLVSLQISSNVAPFQYLVTYVIPLLHYILLLQYRVRLAVHLVASPLAGMHRLWLASATVCAEP
jgi:hypothetical protein